MNLSMISEPILKSPFATQIEANLPFDIVQVIDATIKLKNATKWKFIEHANYLTQKAGQELTIAQLSEINKAYQDNFDKTMAEALAGKLILKDGTLLTGLKSDMAIVYGLRNFGAHNVSAMASMRDKFPEFEQAVFNTLFAAVDYLC